MKWILGIALFAALSGCASQPSVVSDPYPGSGGGFMGTPSQEAIKSGKIDFSTKRFASFRIGRTTKSEVASALGQPAGWSTFADGTSILEYDYVQPANGFGFGRVMPSMFNFSNSKVLTRINYPGYDSGKSK